MSSSFPELSDSEFMVPLQDTKGSNHRECVKLINLGVTMSARVRNNTRPPVSPNHGAVLLFFNGAKCCGVSSHETQLHTLHAFSNADHARSSSRTTANHHSLCLSLPSKPSLQPSPHHCIAFFPFFSWGFPCVMKCFVEKLIQHRSKLPPCHSVAHSNPLLSLPSRSLQGNSDSYLTTL